MQDEPINKEPSDEISDYSAFTNEMEAEELAMEEEAVPLSEIDAGETNSKDSEEEDVLDLEVSNFNPDLIKRPGPGLPESLAWIVGMMAVQVFAQFIALVVLVPFIYLANDGFEFNFDPAGLKKLEKLITEDYFALLLGITQGVTAVVVFVAVIARLGGRKAIPRLPATKLHIGYIGLLLMMFIPILTFTGQWHAMVIVYWNSYVIPLFPFLENLEKLSSMHILKEMINTTQLWALVLIIAVAPAITEELVFRGLIGRGLVARWGIVPGIVLTSILFAAVHLSPTHALALMPLAVVLHLLHLATRSIWAPMLLHFLNNAIAVGAAKMALSMDADALEKAGGPPQYSIPLFIGSGLCLCAFCWLLWSLRYKFHSVDGTELPEGYAAAEAPPQEQHAKGSMGKIQVEPIIASAFGIVIFVLSIIYASWDTIVMELNK